MNIVFPKMPFTVAGLGVEELDLLCMVKLGKQMEKKYFKETTTHSMSKINEFTFFFFFFLLLHFFQFSRNFRKPSNPETIRTKIKNKNRERLLKFTGNIEKTKMGLNNYKLR